jgi:hypothetical protein
MQTMRKPGIVALVIILAVSNLCGQIKAAAEIKAAGKLLIPTAAGEKPYKCIIFFTQREIRLECDKRIFQTFNLFDSPKQAKIKVNTAEVERIQIQKNMIFIIRFLS